MSLELVLATLALTVAAMAGLLALGLAGRVAQLEQDLRAPRAGVLARQGLELGSDVPAVAMEDADGRPLDWARIRAGPSLIVFSSTACEPCKDFATSLPRFAQQFPEWELVVVSRGEMATPHPYADGRSRLVPDPQGDLWNAFANAVTPHVFVVRSGRIVGKAITSKWEEIEGLTHLAPALSETPANTPASAESD